MRNLILALALSVLGFSGAASAAEYPYSEIRYNSTPEGLTFASVTVEKRVIGGEGTIGVTYSTNNAGKTPNLYVEGKAVTANELAAWSFARIGTRVERCENGNLYFSGGTLWQTNTTTCPNGNCPRR